MQELDPDRSVHDSACRWCKAKVPVPLSKCRLERRPWRFVWRCVVCGNVAMVKIQDDLVGELLLLDRVGGSVVSQREIDFWSSMDVELFSEFAAEEL